MQTLSLYQDFILLSVDNAKHEYKRKRRAEYFYKTQSYKNRREKALTFDQKIHFSCLIWQRIAKMKKASIIFVSNEIDAKLTYEIFVRLQCFVTPFQKNFFTL
jgi:hypothetical protein